MDRFHTALRVRGFLLPGPGSSAAPAGTCTATATKRVT